MAATNLDFSWELENMLSLRSLWRVEEGRCLGRLSWY